MNELYGDDSASRVQGYLASEKVAEGVMALTGVTAVAKAGLKKVLLPKVDKRTNNDKITNLNFDEKKTALNITEIEIKKVILIDKDKYPESAKHIEEAQKSGHPVVLTVDRVGAKNNRKESLKGIKTQAGMDRDEYPPAMFKEGGKGASVKLIPSSDNRGSGAGCRGINDGDSIILQTTSNKSSQYIDNLKQTNNTNAQTIQITKEQKVIEQDRFETSKRIYSKENKLPYVKTETTDTKLLDQIVDEFTTKSSTPFVNKRIDNEKKVEMKKIRENLHKLDKQVDKYDSHLADYDVKSTIEALGDILE